MKDQQITSPQQQPSPIPRWARLMVISSLPIPTMLIGINIFGILSILLMRGVEDVLTPLVINAIAFVLAWFCRGEVMMLKYSDSPIPAGRSLGSSFAFFGEWLIVLLVVMFWFIWMIVLIET